jgi:hypothetical protein
MVTRRGETLVNKLMYLCLGFLDTNHVGLLLSHPLEESLTGRGTNPIGVQADYSKQFAFLFLGL